MVFYDCYNIRKKQLHIVSNNIWLKKLWEQSNASKSNTKNNQSDSNNNAKMMMKMMMEMK